MLASHILLKTNCIGRSADVQLSCDTEVCDIVVFINKYDFVFSYLFIHDYIGHMFFNN